jgi:hypothetical protein
MPCPSRFTVCHEQWSEMTPVERGRLCAKCDKVLIDFSEMTEAEIRAYHLQHPGTCGFYSLSQFHRPGSRLAAAAAAAALGLTMPTMLEATMQEPTPGVVSADVAPIDTVVVKGSVIDSASNHPIVGAQVALVGTRIGAITDNFGQYRFVMRSPVTLPLRVHAQYIGYQTRVTTVTSVDSLASLDFALGQSFVGIVGLEIIGETRPLVPQRKPSFWRRLWQKLGGGAPSSNR